jgi:hypothetical protein
LASKPFLFPTGLLAHRKSVLRRRRSLLLQGQRLAVGFNAEQREGHPDREATSWKSV